MSNEWRVVVLPGAAVDGVVLQVVERVLGAGVMHHRFSLVGSDLLAEGVAALEPSLTMPDPMAAPCSTPWPSITAGPPRREPCARTTWPSAPGWISSWVPW